MKGEYLLYFALVIVGLILFFMVVPKFLNVMPLSFSNNLLTGKAVIEDYNFNVGDSLRGRISINLDSDVEGDELVLLSLEKEDEIIYNEVVLLKYLLKDSGVIDKDYIYTKKRVYFVELEEVIDFNFEEAGNYELMISILDFDLTIIKKFSVN